ncbi:hypothetical protein ACFFGT_13930 [Mucilaginibacter angelicae]|uniref:Secreted protein n=1 Tax=Mucilaginibacter angelicae TaxID=869718 RepID=A0ABV6L794_9SPHI
MIDFLIWALPAAWAFRCKSSPFLPAIPTRAVGFTLQSLTLPHAPLLKYILYVITVFFRFPDGNDIASLTNIFNVSASSEQVWCPTPKI